MVNYDNLFYVGRIAYELASAGRLEDFTAIRGTLYEEGHAESIPTLVKPGVEDAINEICAINRRVAAQEAFGEARWQPS
jgi:hypothetical protein